MDTLVRSSLLDGLAVTPLLLVQPEQTSPPSPSTSLQTWDSQLCIAQAEWRWTVHCQETGESSKPFKNIKNYEEIVFRKYEFRLTPPSLRPR